MGLPRNLVALAALLTVVIAVLIICDLNAILLDTSRFAGGTSGHNKFVLREDKCTENGSTELRCNCSNSAIAACPPPSPARVVEKEVIVKRFVRQEPWYAEGRFWHYPIRFPRCTMDVCFNYSRCDNMQGDLRVYTYDVPGPPNEYYFLLNTTKWHTTDPEKACIFLAFLDTRNLSAPHPRELPYWNGGMNHALVTFRDVWFQTRVYHQGSIGFASLLMSTMHETVYRPGFDISSTLPPKFRMTEFQHLKPFERKYFLTFRGVRYLGHDVGTLRSEDDFRHMHNGKDIIVAVTCRRPGRRLDPAQATHCEEDEQIFAKYNYTDLMNTTFGLAPAGRSPSSFRFPEILSAGAIPVLIADNYVKPFDTLIQWHKCLLQFPSTEMHRIVPTLRKMSKEEVEKRQEYCLKAYNEYFVDDHAMLKAAIDSLKARFIGAIPNLTPLTRL